VALRALHSIVHIGWNNVMHRLVVFAIGNTVLMAMWLRFAVSLV
jgi:hypothetical protein